MWDWLTSSLKELETAPVAVLLPAMTVGNHR
jgi:hypothetical protein